ncbi:MAG TPA: glycosyltransferase family 4 protein [Flavisolibacter sp.]|nr:glycosyltransferase family 4 protein [Flavisolibacter sp.]
MQEAKMTILMTADTVGGVWTYCMELCKSLQKFGAEVHLVTMGDKIKKWQREEVQELKNVVVHETDFRLEWMQSPWLDIEECSEWLLHMEDEIQPDIIHLNCFVYGHLPFKAPKIIVTHSDVYSWFLSVKKDDPMPEWQKYFWCVKNGLLGADRVIAPSQTMLQYMQSIYTVRSDQQVIYNGRSSELFYAAKKSDTVFSMGRIWDEAKNIKLLVDAAPNITAPIQIAGANQFAENSFHLTHSNVEYVGKLSTLKIAEHLSTAAVYVLPAKYEPFGLSVLEAAFSKCALVLGDIESLHEIWEDAAFYVDTNDAEDLADAVNYLMNNKDVRDHYAEKAFQQAQKYKSERMGAEYFNVYQELIKKELTSKEALV